MKLLWKLLLLAAIVLVVHGFIVWATTEAFDPRTDADLATIERAVSAPTDVLFLSASVNWFTAPGDNDRRKVSEILADELQVEVAEIDHAAYHLGVFDGICRYSSRTGSSPERHWVVSVNLRSFSNHWLLRPRWRFDELSRFLHGEEPSSSPVTDWTRRLIARPLRTFKAIPDPKAQYLNAPVFDGDRRVGTVSDVESSVEPLDHIIDRYAGTIHPDSERVQQLTALARCARQGGLRILFFVPPVDHEYCKAHYGDAFTERLRRNVTTLRGVLSDEGFELLDLSESLSSAHFAHDGRPDEHLTEGGRQSLARSLAVAAPRFRAYSR